MIEFAVGIAVGAAFSPFWMKVWNGVKALPAVKKFFGGV